MKLTILTIAAMFAMAALPIHAQYVELTSGTTHLAVIPIDPGSRPLGVPQGNNGQQGLMLSVMSDDATTSGFDITVTYQPQGGIVQTVSLTINKTKDPNSAWSTGVLWLGTAKFAVLSAEVREHKATALFDLAH